MAGTVLGISFSKNLMLGLGMQDISLEISHRPVLDSCKIYFFCIVQDEIEVN